MSIQVVVATLDPAILWSGEGVSEESRRIRELVREISAQRRRPASFAWRGSLLDQVWEILQTCANQGWDGYDAKRISGESGSRAAQLIELLPEGIQIPSVVPEPTGDISLEWRTDDKKHFSLSVTGPALVYAGIFGGSFKSYGEERFFRVLPRTILEILTSYFPAA